MRLARRWALALAALSGLAAGCATDVDRPGALPPDQAAVEAALLTVDDLPDGYERVHTETADSMAYAGCEGHEATEPSPLVQASVVFSSPEAAAGPYLVESIAVFARGGAEAQLRATADIVANCSRRGDPSGDEGNIDFRSRPNVPLGDDSYAYEIAFTEGLSGNITQHVLLVRRGDAILTIGTTAIYDGDPTLDEDIVQRAYDRLLAAAA